MPRKIRRPLTTVKVVENVIYRDRDVIKHVPNPETEARLQEALAELEATKASVDERGGEDTEPPEEIAGFFDGKPHGMAAQELLEECTRLGHLVQMKLATPEQSDMHTVLLRHQPYLRSKAVEVI